MKKGEIKRRKRVIPASHAPSPGAIYPSSVGIDDQASQHQGSSENNSQPRSLYPPPVDFTSYRNSPPGTIPSPDPSQAPRKRTHSEANDSPQTKPNGHALPIHNDRRLPSPTRHDYQTSAPSSDTRSRGSVDPSLAAIDPSLRTGNTAAKEAEEKRLKLREERERVRAQLQALDAQLARIDDDEM
jgi:hypothetical protein